MAQGTFHFPRGFLWGAATAAHQVEGNNKNSNWWAWEQEPGRIAQGHTSGLACDWWGGRWREDLDRAAQAGQNAHRLSIEWGRIQPAPDRWDEDALDHYREIMQGMHERNLTPLVTLHHFTLPLWLAEQGSWENDAILLPWEKYVRKVVEALKEYVTLWCPVNEPNNLAYHTYILGLWPPGKPSLPAYIRASVNLIRAHALAYRVIHSLQPQARVGSALHYRGFEPARPWFPPDKWMAGALKGVFSDSFMTAITTGKMPFPFSRRIPEAKGTQDFMGVNYYTFDNVAFNLLHPKEFFTRRYYTPGADLSDTGYIANEPLGLYRLLEWGLQFKVPMIITENGVEDADDRIRPRYILQHIHQVWRGVNFNWPVKGYFYWSLVDNFEWERGWTQRFGLWELDTETQARRKRPSADLYAGICRENGISSELVAKYAPELLPKLFPDG